MKLGYYTGYLQGLKNLIILVGLWTQGWLDIPIDIPIFVCFFQRFSSLERSWRIPATQHVPKSYKEWCWKPKVLRWGFAGSLASDRDVSDQRKPEKIHGISWKSMSMLDFLILKIWSVSNFKLKMFVFSMACDSKSLNEGRAKKYIDSCFHLFSWHIFEPSYYKLKHRFPFCAVVAGTSSG